jgi:hypothetical protein
VIAGDVFELFSPSAEANVLDIHEFESIYFFYHVSFLENIEAVTVAAAQKVAVRLVRVNLFEKNNASGQKAWKFSLSALELQI